MTGLGRGFAVETGFGSQGIHALRTVDVVRGLGDEVRELPGLPFLTVMTTSFPVSSAVTSTQVSPSHSACT